MDHIVGVDVVVGYRRRRHSVIRLKPWLISRVYHSVLRLLFGLRFTDVNWLHFYRSQVVEKKTGNSDGVFFLAENLICARRSGFRITGTDIGFLERKGGRGSGHRVATIVRTMIEMLKFAVR